MPYRLPTVFNKRQWILDRLVDPAVREKVLMLNDVELGELGVDAFGFDPELLKYVAIPSVWLYRYYFRVIAEGVQNVPGGRALIVSNHSGQLPFDGMMLATSLVVDRNPPRVVRSMVEKWVPRLPFVSVFFARMGQVVGTPENCRRLLDRDEAILVFPEGTRGISKTIDKRYQLASFGQGFMRLALESKAPIIPAAVVGAEEQAPALLNIKSLAKMIGTPSFPVTPTFPLLGPLGLLPLPTRYRIYFGEAMRFEGHGDEDDELIEGYVEEVRTKVSALIRRGLRERPGVFA